LVMGIVDASFATDPPLRRLRARADALASGG
jgi:hypothetical protein